MLNLNCAQTVKPSIALFVSTGQKQELQDLTRSEKVKKLRKVLKAFVNNETNETINKW